MRNLEFQLISRRVFSLFLSAFLTKTIATLQALFSIRFVCLNYIFLLARAPLRIARLFARLAEMARDSHFGINSRYSKLFQLLLRPIRHFNFDRSRHSAETCRSNADEKLCARTPFGSNSSDRETRIK